jgi:hypothetical protein
LLQVYSTIPPFGILIKKIKIASFRERQACKNQEEEEMRAYSSNRGYKSITKTFLPVIPLVKIKLDSDRKDKASFITFELKVRAGAGAGTPSYKKSIKTFEEGTPQEWMDVLNGLKEIWKQNSVNGPTDRAATVAAILKGDSITAFDAAMEDARVNPALVGEEDPVPLPMTLEHVDKSLRAVTDIVFPFRAMETQKQWMSRHMRKPYDLPMKNFEQAVSRINNYLPSFPNGTPNSKYNETELVELLECALPSSWRRTMDINGFVPSLNNKAALVNACERIERNEVPIKRDRDHSRDNNNNHRSTKKIRFGKTETGNKKYGRTREPSNDERFFCKECGYDKNHNTESCFKLKKIAREKEAGVVAKAFTKPYTKRTFRKEVNAMARRAGKNDGLRIVELAVKREKGKQARFDTKNYAKAAAAKKAEDTDSDTSNESMHNLEARIPLKKKFAAKYTDTRNVRYNSKGEIVAIEGDSDSEEDRKMPAKISKKRAHKSEHMDDTSSDESDGDNKATAEEKAFLKAIGKKEQKDSAKDYKNESD